MHAPRNTISLWYKPTPCPFSGVPPVVATRMVNIKGLHKNVKAHQLAAQIGKPNENGLGVKLSSVKWFPPPGQIRASRIR